MNEGAQMRWRVLTATSPHIILRRAVFQGAFRPSLLGHVETRRRPVSTVCHRGSLHFLWNNLVQAIPPTARRSQNQGKRLGRGWRANYLHLCCSLSLQRTRVDT